MNCGDYRKYIWQRKEWPHWSFNSNRLQSLLSQVNLERGKLLGTMQTLGFELSDEASLKALTSEVVKSSEIEGEKLSPESVRSSLARRLGMDVTGLVPSDRNTDGVVEMVLNATLGYEYEMTDERLYDWHAALFPAGRSGMHKITVGAFRSDSDGPMQVISGSIGREKVHYEAPPADRLHSEAAYFLLWFEQKQAIDPVIKAGLAHLWFETLHPFEDGNGRIGRAICDMVLSKADESSKRFYSLSAQMLREKEDYYNQLEQAQKGELDVTDWLEWFLGCLLRAVLAANDEVKDVVYFSALSRRLSGNLNTRHVDMLNRLMHGFEGNLTSGKWAKLAKCSTDTALRDIEELVNFGVLEKVGESRRGTHYVMMKR